MFGAIAGFYLYYLGGCVVGQLLPRSLAPVKGIDADGDLEAQEALFFWGEPEEGVRLLFELGASGPEGGPSFSDERWSRVLGLPPGSHRYGSLHVMRFVESGATVSFPDRDGVAELVTRSGASIPSRSIRQIVNREEITPSAWAQVQSLSPGREVEVGPFQRFRLLLAFPEAGIVGVSEVRAFWRGSPVVLRLGHTDREELARFVMNPDSELPETWGKLGNPEMDAVVPPTAEGLEGPELDPQGPRAESEDPSGRKSPTERQ